ncbi:MAG TPA: ABC transporter ATP-binding protein [Terriglobales bacterium]|nr:ABC transporter ATP-binding protein [Terriglobales bacterium]
MGRASNPALSARSLARRFHSGASELVIFEDLSLEVARGEMVAIVGESGSGKSSLLHLLSGLDRPTAGDVYFEVDGVVNEKTASLPRSLASMGEEELARFRNCEIGFVWQQHYLLPEFTAMENVMMPLLISATPRAEASRRAQVWLDAVGLGSRLDHRSGELSGGEQQRVALARALVTEPHFLMADEPTGNLDERTGIAVFDLLARLHHQHSLTSIIVTHNHQHAARCDRRLCLHQGRLQEESLHV